MIYEEPYYGGVLQYIVPREDKKKDEEKDFSRLQESVAHGDVYDMFKLAECYAFGCGTERNCHRAEALLVEAAEKGNPRAQSLLQVIDKCKTESAKGCECLFMNLLHCVRTWFP